MLIPAVGGEVGAREARWVVLGGEVDETEGDILDATVTVVGETLEAGDAVLTPVSVQSTDRHDYGILGFGC